MNKDVSGIYAITAPNGAHYIGSSKHIGRRRAQHLRALSTNNHHNKYLQKIFNKYGRDGLVFSIILICGEENLFMYEQILLDNFKPQINGSPSASGSRGLKWSLDSKSKIIGRYVNPDLVREGMLRKFTKEERSERARIARSGWTEESKASLIRKLTGKKHSPETIEKRAKSLVGRKVSPETRAKLAKQAGWKHTEETKIKMRESKKRKFMASTGYKVEE